jgi:starch synthase
MACALPVIATDYPGVRAVVDDGRTGALVKRGDAGAVAASLRELIDAEPGQRREMGAAGREKALREWSWPRLVERMDDVYTQAIEARRA